MAFAPGEIVVFRRSNIKELRKKVYKVMEHDTYNRRVRVMTVAGKQRVFHEYQLESMDEYADILQRHVDWAERAQRVAERKTDKEREMLAAFVAQKSSARSYFKV